MSDLISIIRKRSSNSFNSKLILNHFEKSESEEVIEKSVVDSLSYNNDIKIEKTGKEIKTSLVPLKATIEAQRDEHLLNMSVFKKVAGVEPLEKGNYYYDDISNRLTTPNVYSYDQRYSKDSKSESITYPKESVSISNESKVAMDSYNDCCRKYVKCLADLLTIGTLMANLSDNKKVTLSVNQATALGF